MPDPSTRPVFDPPRAWRAFACPARLPLPSPPLTWPSAPLPTDDAAYRFARQPWAPRPTATARLRPGPLSATNQPIGTPTPEPAPPTRQHIRQPQQRRPKRQTQTPPVSSWPLDTASQPRPSPVRACPPDEPSLLAATLAPAFRLCPPASIHPHSRPLDLPWHVQSCHPWSLLTASTRLFSRPVACQRIPTTLCPPPPGSTHRLLRP
jgi:hypothetical protein